MKEPELDENQLTAAAKNRQITVTRRSLDEAGQQATVTITLPSPPARRCRDAMR